MNYYTFEEVTGSIQFDVLSWKLHACVFVVFECTRAILEIGKKSNFVSRPLSVVTKHIYYGKRYTHIRVDFEFFSLYGSVHWVFYHSISLRSFTFARSKSLLTFSYCLGAGDIRRVADLVMNLGFKLKYNLDFSQHV